MAATDLYLKPLLASINSIIQHSHQESDNGTPKKRDLYFHLLLAPGDANLLYDELFSYFRDVPFELVEFNGDRVKPLIRVWHGMDRHSSNLNHARFFLPDIFPTLSEIIYLDPDTIINGDIGQLVEEFRTRQDKTKYFAAVISKKINLYSGTYDYLVNCHDPIIKQLVKDPNSKYFNAGVFITDLDHWRKEGVTPQLENWMRLNTQRKLWNWGSQAPLALVFYDKWYELNSDWNERRMQYYSWAEFSTTISPTVKLYHFSGEVKPWKSNGKSMWHLWCRYYPKKEEYWFCKDESWRNLSPSSMWSYEFLRGL